MSKLTSEEKEAKRAAKIAVAERKRAERLKKKKKEAKGFWADFKKFISKGNIIDLSVAVVVGAAFNAIVKGVVDFVITPLISVITGGIDMTQWKQVLSTKEVDGEVVEVAIMWGSLLQAVINFLIVALVIFVILRFYAKLQKVAKDARSLLQQEEIEKQKREEQKKKAEEEAKAKQAAAEKAALEERETHFYQNVDRQTALLEEIAAKLASSTN